MHVTTQNLSNSLRSI